MAKNLGPIEFDPPCAECKLVPVLILGERALTFGHIYSTAGLKAYLATGMCEWCQEYTEDFAHMGRKGEFLT